MKVAALRLFAYPLDLLISLSLLRALIYALVLHAPYPLAAGLTHPLASWATLPRILGERVRGVQITGSPLLPV